jgi:hypothetical protein
MRKSSQSSLRGFRITIFVVLLGLPLFVLFALFTYDAVLLPLLGLLILAPFLFLNYAVWGWHSAFKPKSR